MSKEKRRKVLKSLAVGAPVVWAKPVVDSVLLPAHGAMSCEQVQSFDLLEHESERALCCSQSNNATEWVNCLAALCISATEGELVC